MIKKLLGNICKVGAGASVLWIGLGKSVGVLHFKAPHNPRNLLQVDDLENKIKGDNYYSLKSRADHLEDVTKNPDYDLLVIGGGATGAGVAFDASCRGLRVLVVDSYDFASGTSSKSSKLLHGGIRYLGEVFKLEWGVDRAANWHQVKEALQEKSTVQNSAPYMTSNTFLVIPQTNIFAAIHKWLGVLMYTLIGKWQEGEYEYLDCGQPQWQGASELINIFPELSKKFKYGLVLHDTQMNDTRMCLDTLLTSTIDEYIPGMKGSNIINYCKFKEFTKDPKTGHITGGTIIDKFSGVEYKVNAKVAVNATGVFSDTIRKADNDAVQPRIVAAAGTHISMPSQLTKSGYGLILPTDDERILFLLPWLGKTIAGTTDEVRDHIEQHTLSTQPEVEFIISNISQSMKLDKFSTEELVSSKWCGLRPLVLGDEAMKDGHCHNAVGELKPGLDTRFLARTHEIEVSESGLLSIMGGKWTTFRKMGEEAVDAALQIMLERDLISTEQQRRQAEHKSHRVRFIGDYRPKTSIPNTSGIKYTHDEYKAYLCEALKKHWTYDDKFILYVANVYGDRAFDLLRYIQDKPGHQQKIHSSLATLRGEVSYSIERELCTNPVDFLARRTRIAFLDRKTLDELLPVVVEEIARHYNFDQERQAEYLKQYQILVAKMEF